MWGGDFHNYSYYDDPNEITHHHLYTNKDINSYQVIILNNNFDVLKKIKTFFKLIASYNRFNKH